MKKLSDNMNDDFKGYFQDKVKNFDESTILSPNKNGNKEDGNICKSIYEIDENISEFCKNNAISENSLILASVLLTLNKFNYSDKNLIYIEDNMPFSGIFENRQISVKKYLSDINETYNEISKYKNDSFKSLLDEYNLKPEFYFAFDEDSNSEINYTIVHNLTFIND